MVSEEPEMETETEEEKEQKALIERVNEKIQKALDVLGTITPEEVEAAIKFKMNDLMKTVNELTFTGDGDDFLSVTHAFYLLDNALDAYDPSPKIVFNFGDSDDDE